MPAVLTLSLSSGVGLRPYRVINFVRWKLARPRSLRRGAGPRVAALVAWLGATLLHK